MKIVFLGTPDFAVPSLELINQKFDLVAVITAPDKKAEEDMFGLNLQLRNGHFCMIKIATTKNLKSKKFLNELEQLSADVFVVVAFRMLPKEVWNMPKLGTINLHGSLLPKYRGAAPIQRAILNGEKLQA